MLSHDEIKSNKEISKLIEYGYDLHKREMDRYERSIPNFEFYNGNCCPMKKVNGGGIFGMRGYPNHSVSYMFTTLGITVGKQNEDDFDMDYAVMIQTDSKNRDIHFSNLKIADEQKRYYTTLDYDRAIWFDNMPDEYKYNMFIKVMEFVGFRKEDIIAVLNGALTAREAYMNVAPEEIRNLQWVSKGRRLFVFNGNVAIEGSFGSMDMDEFPFPFQEQPILDCSKVKTACIYFESNKRKVKLINVNSNPESIIYTDLKNAIIEEPIDLYLVDASGTKFGHHTVINLEYSKAKLDDMNLHLAVNEHGERFVVDEKGRVEVEYGRIPKTISYTETKSNNLLVLANADNEEMVKEALENDADGIGLVRTEHIFTDKKDVQKMVEILDWTSDETKEENLKRFKELQINQVKEILGVIGNKPIVFRLLDFKLKEYLRNYGLTLDDYDEYDNEYDDDYDDAYIDSLRGANILCQMKYILITQIEAIFETLDGKNVDANLLIPMLTSPSEFTCIKEEIIKLSKNYNLKSLQIGAMVENREISNDADELAKEADFISIGTNDLTESVTGLSRDTNSIEFQELTDEVKSVIEETIYRARSTNPNIVIGICGEHSNYVENLPYYSSLDINYIACSPSFIIPNREFLGNNCNLETGSAKQLKFSGKRQSDKK